VADLILASDSPRRAALLRELGRPFRVVSPEVEESRPRGLSPQEAAQYLAVRKAESAARRLREGLVLAADTLVSVGERIVGKPRTREEAVEILHTLSRRPHVVITGVCLLDAASGRRRVAVECSRVVMRPMSREEIEAYVDTGEPMDKAGAYAVQEKGDRFVERIEGSFSNVVGLPLERVRRLLEEMEGPDSPDRGKGGAEAG